MGGVRLRLISRRVLSELVQELPGVHAPAMEVVVVRNRQVVRLRLGQRCCGFSTLCHTDGAALPAAHVNFISKVRASLGCVAFSLRLSNLLMPWQVLLFIQLNYFVAT